MSNIFHRDIELGQYYSVNPYEISGLTLIPQADASACWYAAAMMLVKWRRNRRQMSETAHPSPSEVPAQVERMQAEEGLPPSLASALAHDLGLETVPLHQPTAEHLRHLLVTCGPLWVMGQAITAEGKTASGSYHAVVIGGVRNYGADVELKIYDPWPVNTGEIRWSPAAHLGMIFKVFESETWPAHEGRIRRQLRRLTSSDGPPVVPTPWNIAMMHLPPLG